MKFVRRAWLILLSQFILLRASAEPILFVTQTPFSYGDPALGAVFGNHQGSANLAPRGGDLYIRYDDGTLRNLTQELGYGIAPSQEICVRDPHVHWDGQKALFSMVIGGTTPGDLTPVYFQIYEITGILQNQAAHIAKLNQPDNYNNVNAIYGIDDSILFVTDSPRSGDPRLFPLHDEYRGQLSNTGLWQMNADGTSLHVVDPCPSGDFLPFIDSYGRILVTRWDHLQRDQQADLDVDAILQSRPLPFRCVTFTNENDFTTHTMAPGDEIFPQLGRLHPKGAATPDLVWDYQRQSDEFDFEFNRFFPWTLNPDGTDLEILNHLGRHELNTFVRGERTGLPNLGTIIVNPDTSPSLAMFNMIHEDPTNPGRYYGINSAEFMTHSAGQIQRIDAPKGLNADFIRTQFVTYYETQNPLPENGSVTSKRIGLFRDPLPRPNGELWAVHSASPFTDQPTSAVLSTPPTTYTLVSRCDFKIKRLAPSAIMANRMALDTAPGSVLIPAGISKTVKYFDNAPHRPMLYSGPLWEWQPVSVVARSRAAPSTSTFPAIEQAIALTELGGTTGVAKLQNWLTSNSLALIISRDVTVRADRQQDYNLKVKWSNHTTPPNAVNPKEIAWFQIVQAAQIRGYNGTPGRRNIGQPIPDDLNPSESGAPPGAVRIGDDGSMAAFVPARRALSWQTTELDGKASARERYWVTFQPGEMRVCTNCHGINQKDIFGNSPPTNSPQAATDLLRWWNQTYNQPTTETTSAVRTRWWNYGER